MTQEQLDELINDGLELFGHGDQTELAEFIGYLADKYNLEFDGKKYLRSW